MPIDPQTTKVKEIRIGRGPIVSVPRVPNYLCEPNGQTSYSVGNFSDAELRKVGKLWTDNLIKRAHEVRNAKP